MKTSSSSGLVVCSMIVGFGVFTAPIVRAATAPADAWPFPTKATAAGTATFETTDVVGLYNRHVGVLIQKKDLLIAGLWSAEGWSLVDNRRPVAGILQPLWALEVMPRGAEKPAAARSASAKNTGFAFVSEKGGKSLTITSEGVTADNVSDFTCTVIARIGLGDDSPEVRWTAEVVLPEGSPASAWSLVYPQLVVAAPDPGEKENRLLVPHRRGVLSDFGKGSSRWDNERPYPGPGVKFQFTAAYGEASGRGLYLATEDPKGSDKGFIWRNHPGQNSLVMAVRHLPAGRGVVGTGFQMPYPVVTRPFRGDWWDAARFYRTWWQRQAWAPDKFLQDRTDVPDWLKRAPAIVRISTSQKERTIARNLETALQIRNILGRGYVGVWYAYQDPGESRWGLDGSGNGNLLPAKAGVAEALKELKKNDIHIMAYVQSVIYNAGLDQADTEQALKAVTRDRAGKIGLYGKEETQFAMCRATDWWQTRLCQIAEKAVGEIGFEGIYLDSFGKGGNECFAPDHGHPIGGGDTVTQGQVALGTRVRQTIRKLNPNVFMSGEAPNENYKNILDVDLYAVNIWNGYVPIYRVVWGDYNLGHGRTIRYSKNNDNMVPELASMFLDGTIIGRFFCEGDFIFSPEKQPADLAYFKKLVAYTDAGLDYLRFGECLRPLALAVPDLTFTEGVENGLVTVPAVMNHVLRSHRDGSVAIVLVNVGATALEADVPIDPALRAESLGQASPEAKLSRMDETGRRTQLRTGRAPWKEHIKIEPREVVFLILQ